MEASRNIGIVAALREVGAFADQPGTLGVNACFGATHQEVWPGRRYPSGLLKTYVIVAGRPWVNPLDPLTLEAARASGRPLDVIASQLWARLSDALDEHRGRVLVTWAGLSQSMRDMLTVVLIGAPRSWVI